MRMTTSTLRVLEAMLARRGEEHYGYELLKATGLKGGSLYPILQRLEEARWIDGHWQQATTDGRPPRRFYRLTGLGVTSAEFALEKAREHSRSPLALGVEL